MALMLYDKFIARLGELRCKTEIADRCSINALFVNTSTRGLMTPRCFSPMAMDRWGTLLEISLRKIVLINRNAMDDRLFVMTGSDD